MSSQTLPLKKERMIRFLFKKYIVGKREVVQLFDAVQILQVFKLIRVLIYFNLFNRHV